MLITVCGKPFMQVNGRSNMVYRVVMVACAALDMPEWDLRAVGTGV